MLYLKSESMTKIFKTMANKACGEKGFIDGWKSFIQRMFKQFIKQPVIKI